MFGLPLPLLTKNNGIMRTITRTFNVFQVTELSEKAFNKSYNKWLESFDYLWDKENRRTLDVFEDWFNVNVYQWEYDTINYNYRFQLECADELEELSGIRLYKYLVNTYWNYLFKKKIYYNRNGLKKRTSNIFYNHECVMTGYIMDDVILKPIYDFLQRPDNSTYYELIDRCLNAFFSACSEDMENMESERYFKEECNANGWEFLENGEMFS